ncbi:DUF1800 domain-containing protein [Shimia sp. MMG029]|uniref:DUF1800 domain-containing protein n=1 Tax=Shimia sp. MMG029 TaxID=3021978 RepID=UPI0022FEA829|nr:DUF1800 domain-containing protein [Shimia sp. MMG029]MDA5556433.1 DUF1800 domain-containing protein [Shimia sp. MMG029]
MGFDPDIAQMRFGYGLSPVVPGPASVDAMVAQLRRPDAITQRFVIPTSEAMNPKVRALYLAQRAYKRAERGSKDRHDLRATYRKALKAARVESAGWVRQALLRRIWSEDGLRERLVAFWADHFTAPGQSTFYRYAAASYVETAIRPHVAARFEDMLIAAVTHPQMLQYLDQNRSVGPNSRFAKKRQNGAGLNENLAREVLELHTLGVHGSYTQKDVREFAELLTGLTAGTGQDTRYDSKRIEPGAETVLGQTYGTRRARISDIHAALRDLARHPETARHLAQKIARHFLGDQPDAGLVMELEIRYRETDGDLGAVVEAMLRHEAAWHARPEGGGNFKQPEQFVSSALRALAVPEARFLRMDAKTFERLILSPLRHMGQPWRRPFGPDGFAEEDAHWLSPQGMGARLQWALASPAAVAADLPDPREFVGVALGAEAPAVVHFAAKAAENRREGIALVLMSPAFQRV